MSRKVIFLAALATLLCGPLAAQTEIATVTEAVADSVEVFVPTMSTEEFRMALSQTDSLSGGAVWVVEDEASAADAVRRFDLHSQPRQSYDGYRIRLYSGNNQQARAEAEAVQQLFRENYAVPVYFSYENPYFMVSCGNCLTHEEAIMLLSKVRIHFPKAFIVACEIPAELFVNPPQVSVYVPEEQTAEAQPTTEVQQAVEVLGVE